ncbi:MAG TPA: Stf0 family sulfotransferase [Solirubrobacteraceae bacterium]|nr:Stf0 family sulfotransferase [Solirubrobacteraceae bacterium]
MTHISSYLVCSTQRSGSTLLCELLKSTGVAGCPDEFFEGRASTGVPPHPRDYLRGLDSTGMGIRSDRTPPAVPSYSDLRGISYREHLERSFRLGTTANGVFGSKLMWNQLDELKRLASQLDEYAGLEPPELLDALFGNPRYVWVRRRDKVRQAISLWRALQTREWSSGDADSGERASELAYHFEALDHLVRLLSDQDDAWERYFASIGSPQLTIAYEDELECDQAGTVRRALDHIGVALPDRWEPAARVSRQADAINDEWYDAYHRKAAARLARA